MQAGERGGRRHGEVRPQGPAEGREGDARAEARDAEEREVREEGEEPQAGDRDRAVPGAPRGWEGSAQEEVVVEAKEVSAPGSRACTPPNRSPASISSRSS